jgi:hypothetical protein
MLMRHGLLISPRDLADRQSCRCPKIPAQPPHHTTSFFSPRIDCQLPSAASVQCRRCRSRPRRHVLASPASCPDAIQSKFQSNHLFIPTVNRRCRPVRARKLPQLLRRRRRRRLSESNRRGEHEPRRTAPVQGNRIDDLGVIGHSGRHGTINAKGAGRNSRSVEDGCMYHAFQRDGWCREEGPGPGPGRAVPAPTARCDRPCTRRQPRLARQADHTCASAGRPVRCCGVCWTGLDWTGSVSSRQGEKEREREKSTACPMQAPAPVVRSVARGVPTFRTGSECLHAGARHGMCLCLVSFVVGWCRCFLPWFRVRGNKPPPPPPRVLRVEELLASLQTRI